MREDVDERPSEEGSGRRDQGCDEERPENNNESRCEGTVIKCRDGGGGIGGPGAVNGEFSEKAPNCVTK